MWPPRAAGSTAGCICMEPCSWRSRPLGLRKADDAAERKSEGRCALWRRFSRCQWASASANESQ
eukprot:COSAG01_NODE_5987_length_3917_cov_40.918282_1_plen_64_part_00